MALIQLQPTAAPGFAQAWAWTQLPYRRPRVARAWRNIADDQPEMAGLGSFLKKAAKTVTKIARAPIKLVSPQLAKNLEKIDNKIIDNLDSVHTKINEAAKRAGKGVQKFVKKNWKWIVVAAAVAVTIYSMGSGSTIAAKMMSGLAKIKTYVAAKTSSALTWGKAKWTLAKAAMGKLIAGRKMGDLSQEEVSAMAEANQATGMDVVPEEVMALLSPSGGPMPESAYGGEAMGTGMEYAAGAPGASSIPMPLILGGAGLALALALL